MKKLLYNLLSKNYRLFLLLVVIPVLSATVYNVFIASPIYISESKMVVKSIGDRGNFGLGAFLEGLGISESNSATSVVVQFLFGYDAMKKLDEKFKLKEYYAKNGDFLSKFAPLGIKDSYEDFYLYYKKNIVNAWVESNSNVVVLQTRAFDGNVSYNLNKELLTLTEDFINTLNKRAAFAMLSYYKEQIENTKQTIDNKAKQLISMFDKTNVVSPEAQLAGQIQLLVEINKKIADKNLELARINLVAPQSPVIDVLRSDIEKLKADSLKLEKLIGSYTGKYSVMLELVKTELNTLQSELNAYIQSYIQAQSQAYMKHLFIETVQNSTFPDSSLEPKRVKNIFTITVICLIVWGIVLLLIAGVKEHKNV